MRPSLSVALAALALASPVWAQSLSSTYTDLMSCPRETSPDDAEAEARGSDVPTKCPGPGGEYRVVETYSAYGIYRRIDLAEDASRFSVALMPTGVECPLARYGDKVEWRLKGKKPFAVIQRVTCFEDSGGGPGKRLGEYLVVKGLQGYESLDGAVNTKTKKANEQARALADKAAKEG
jgi:hypothetical protein